MASYINPATLTLGGKKKSLCSHSDHFRCVVIAGAGVSYVTMRGYVGCGGSCLVSTLCFLGLDVNVVKLESLPICPCTCFENENIFRN